jgi:alpha-tubulin suppressor-like RCC1 family protein
MSFSTSYTDSRPQWVAPTKDADADSDSSDDDDEDSGLNPKESTPTAIPAHSFLAGVKFVQVAASDNASFALTEDGQVYGWGTFRVSEYELLSISDINDIRGLKGLLGSRKRELSLATKFNARLS